MQNNMDNMHKMLAENNMQYMPNNMQNNMQNLQKNLNGNMRNMQNNTDQYAK